MRARSIRGLFLLVLLALPMGAVAADRLSIAAASNLTYALEALNAEFTRTHPSTQLTVVTGASGNLVAQIQNGAPYDVFLSADLEYPEQLVARGLADRSSLVTFAVGRLVLWTTLEGIDVSSPATLVRDPRVMKIAVAHLKTAPYGRAAREALTALGVWTIAEPKIVIGENVTQTAQFVETGNVEAGFVAMSLVLSPRARAKGRWHEVDAGLYSPIEQGAVITRRGEGNPAAARYLTFLRSPEARAVLERFGYRAPKS